MIEILGWGSAIEPHQSDASTSPAKDYHIYDDDARRPINDHSLNDVWMNNEHKIDRMLAVCLLHGCPWEHTETHKLKINCCVKGKSSLKIGKIDICFQVKFIRNLFENYTTQPNDNNNSRLHNRYKENRFYRMIESSKCALNRKKKPKPRQQQNQEKKGFIFVSWPSQCRIRLWHSHSKKKRCGMPSFFIQVEP